MQPEKQHVPSDTVVLEAWHQKRIMYKVAGVAAVPVTLSLMSGTVFAAAEDKPNVTLNTNELSLYTTPQQKFRNVEPGVTTLRKLAEPYVTWCQAQG
ncbi:LOW QUALITY PROTEIN: MICOS complex subunit MIC26-like [Salvelinus alpinus]